MSRSIDLFIDVPLGLDDAAEEITKLTGLRFAASPGGEGRLLQNVDVVAELSRHDYVDDREMRFSRYRYVLATTVASDHSINDSPQAVLLRAIHSALKADGQFPSLLVIDLQRVVDRSGPPSGPSGPSDASLGAGSGSPASAPAEPAGASG